MKILFAASEMAPFAGSDAFGGSVAAMVSGLHALGHDVSVVIPYYRSVREFGGTKIKKTGTKFSVQLGSGRCACEIRESRTSDGVQVFFVERDEFFDRSGLYGVDGRDYQDNAARFTFFSKAVLELMRRMEPAPEIVHACNWQAALIPALVAESGQNVRTALGVQSLEFQGNFWSYDFALTNLPGSYFSTSGVEYYGSMNMLKGGILFADSVVLPGPRYVSESQTSVAGCGLESVMREHAQKLVGVMPGTADASWNPATDKSLNKCFKSAGARETARRAEWKKLGFDTASDGPALIMATDSMLDDGLELALPAFDRLVECGAQLLVLGSANPGQHGALEFALRKHRGSLIHIPAPDEATWRKSIASANALLMPSPVRPDATMLTQALTYGTIPVALACGGLHQIASPADRGGREGVGFYFYDPTVNALVDAVRAMDACRNTPPLREGIISRAMETDTSWAATALGLQSVYSNLLMRSRKRRAA